MFVIICLFLVLVIVISFSNKNEPGIFTPEDTHVLGIKIDMPLNKVEKILGKPDRVKTEYEDAFGADVIYCFYKFGTIRFEPAGDLNYSVSSIVISQPNFWGPRKTKINDDYKTVLKKFPYDPKRAVKDNRKILYGSVNDNTGYESDNIGYIFYDDTGRVNDIRYHFGGEGFGGYTLWYKVKDDKVREIVIAVMNV